MADKPDTKKLTLSRAYSLGGRTVGPGEVEVPADAAAHLEKKEKAHQGRLEEGYEPPAPVTPSVTAGGLVDPRRSKRGEAVGSTAAGPDAAPALSAREVQQADRESEKQQKAAAADASRGKK